MEMADTDAFEKQQSIIVNQIEAYEELNKPKSTKKEAQAPPQMMKTSLPPQYAQTLKELSDEMKSGKRGDIE
jgi:hypothetical protein